MNAGWVRLGFLMLAALVAGCGGGGGAGPGSGVRVSLDTTTLTESSAPVEVGSSRYITLTVTSLPKDGLYVGHEHSSNGLANVSFYQTGETTAVLQLDFRPGASLVDGTYRDTIDVSVCLDTACKTHVAGSPQTVRTTYTVSSTSSARIDATTLDVSARADSSVAPTGSVTITTAGPSPASALHVVPMLDTSTGLASVAAVPVSDTQSRIDAFFLPPNFRAPGLYTDTVTIKVCYDTACTRQVAGSPFTLTTHYTVDSNVLPEPGVTPLLVTSRQALAHNVVDAEFSKALNAVVMVSSLPRHALYVYDLATGTEKQLNLNKLPVAVSISPDGNLAAVGHDALVTHVDLRTVGQASPTVRLLNLSSNTSDLVLDGRGTVHVFPATDQWVKVHSIVVATNVETLANTFPWPYAGNRARLHPSGDTIYAANNGLSPDNIENYHVETGTVSLIGDSRYHGDYAMCGNLWISDDGARIYTACGATFAASTVPANDMLYAGTLPLSTSTYYGYRIQSASALAATKEVALIEQPWYECQAFAGMLSSCYSHLNLYDSDFLTQTARYSFPPVVVAGASYRQLGLFVFHQSSGGRVLISRLDGITNPTAEYYLSVKAP